MTDLFRATRDLLIIEAYLGGATLGALAARHGLSPEGVRGVVRRRQRRERAAGLAVPEDTPALIASVVAARRDGIPASVIRRKYGLTQKRLAAICTAAGVAGDDARAAHPKLAAIEAMIAEGCNSGVIAIRLGVDSRTVDKVRRGEPIWAPPQDIVVFDLGPHPLEGRYDSWPKVTPRLAAVRFVRRRAEIPKDLRRDNAEVLWRVAARVERVEVRQSLAALAALWRTCPTTFAAFDVAPADPVAAAREEARAASAMLARWARPPIGGGVSPAQSCVDVG